MAGKVLIVEDDEDYCELLEHAIAQHGCEVSIRHDAASGLTAVKAIKPALLIMDLNLPRGSGKMVYQAVRADAAFKELPVLVITADIANDSIYEKLEAPPHPKTLIMRKPLDLDWLESFLSKQGL